MPHAFAIGGHKVYRIEEWQGGFCPPENLFAEYDAASFDAQSGLFTPDYYREGNIYVFLQSWLIDTGHETVLIDTGAGNSKERPGIPVFGDLETDFLSKLHEAGYRPEQINKVFCTHLHIDHVGWNTRKVDGRWVPTFPNATYFFPTVDEQAWNPSGSQYALMAGAFVNQNVFEDSVAPIIEAGLARMVTDGDEIAPGMTVRHAPGHTPGHMTLEVVNGQDSALFTGDILHHPMQVIRPDWNSVFCEDRVQAAETRRSVLQRAADNGSRIVPAHFGGAHSIFVEQHSSGFRPIFPDERS